MRWVPGYCPEWFSWGEDELEGDSQALDFYVLLFILPYLEILLCSVPQTVPAELLHYKKSRHNSAPLGVEDLGEQFVSAALPQHDSGDTSTGKRWMEILLHLLAWKKKD